MTQTERSLFEACLEIPEEERYEYLLEACPDREDLRDRVWRLLEAHEDADQSGQRKQSSPPWHELKPVKTK